MAMPVPHVTPIANYAQGLPDASSPKQATIWLLTPKVEALDQWELARIHA
jgi:hypothetical protein